ncbi:hypothetical protein DDQ41_08135 [Streptomyces spongiicola]|uniref:Uncharacterized protein n=1 Tax=Streptomyces spongiicola TaxID=1690221 RepID=A0ABM6V5A0_9ACTN|nr:hypothetical protein DDQ41_08135 [Streptomyces spongiicola]
MLMGAVHPAAPGPATAREPFGGRRSPREPRAENRQPSAVSRQPSAANGERRTANRRPRTFSRPRTYAPPCRASTAATDGRPGTTAR